MRTTAVYGHGKFGLSDLENTFATGLFSRPFEAELLTVYLIREFTFDLVAHLARSRAPMTAVPLSVVSKRCLGIGNATGLGMAPFLIGHPLLIGRWLQAREIAIARVRAQATADAECQSHFFAVLERALRHIHEWHTSDARQTARTEALRSEMSDFATWLQEERDRTFRASTPWNRIAEAAESRLTLEGQELVNSLLLEPHGALVDDLEDSLAVEESVDLDPRMSLAALRQDIEMRYAWALSPNYEDPSEQHFFWYVSEEKLEPRLGERFKELGAEREQRIGIGREVSRLYQAVQSELETEPEGVVAHLLLKRPDLRHIHSSRAKPRGAALRRNPGEFDRSRYARHQHSALQARDVRRHQVRSQVRPLDAHHHVSGRSALRRPGRRHGR